MEFNGIKLSFLKDDVSSEECNNYEKIPSWFWLEPIFEKMPINKTYRKRLCSALFDFNHKDLCSILTICKGRTETPSKWPLDVALIQ